MRILRERLRDILNYNEETGRFFWRISPTRSAIRPGDEAGTIYNNGYRYIQIDGLDYKAARLAWFFVTGEDPQDHHLDHINGKKNDDRFENLRLANDSQNQANAFWRTNTSGIKGIRYEAKRRKWLATITVNGERRFLGRFTQKIDAATAYRNAALDAWGEFAKVPSEEELEYLCNEEHKVPQLSGERAYENL